MVISSRTPSIEACVQSLAKEELSKTWAEAIALSRDTQKYIESLPYPQDEDLFKSMTVQEQLVLVNYTKARGAAWLSFSAELLYALYPDFDVEVDAIVKAPE